MKLLNNYVHNTDISYKWILETLTKNCNCIKKWKDNDVCIIDMAVTIYGGDKGFISDVWKVTLTNDQCGTFSCILKIPIVPDTNLIKKITTFFRKKNVNLVEVEEYPIPQEVLRDLHQKEIIFYEDILPKIGNFRGPKCFGSRNIIPYQQNGALLLELIEFKGSGLCFVETLNENQCLSVMEELIKLQSYSLSLPSLDYHGKMEFPITEKLLEKFSEDAIGNWYHLKMYLCPKMYAEYEEDILVMLKNLPFIYKYVCEIYNNESSNQKVLVHGDLWINNLLFNGDNLVGIIDYQEGHFNNLAYDITRLLVYCTCEQVRNSIIETKLHLYYEELKKKSKDSLKITYQKFLECFDITFILQTIYFMKHTHFALYSCREILLNTSNWEGSFALRMFHLLVESVERTKKVKVKLF